MRRCWAGNPREIESYSGQAGAACHPTCCRPISQKNSSQSSVIYNGSTTQVEWWPIGTGWGSPSGPSNHQWSCGEQAPSYPKIFHEYVFGGKYQIFSQPLSSNYNHWQFEPNTDEQLVWVLLKQDRAKIPVASWVCICCICVIYGKHIRLDWAGTESPEQNARKRKCLVPNTIWQWCGAV